MVGLLRRGRGAVLVGVVVLEGQSGVYSTVAAMSTKFQRWNGNMRWL